MSPPRGLAVNSPLNNTEQYLTNRFKDELPHYLGSYSDACLNCGAIHWTAERTGIGKDAIQASYSMCCKKGLVAVPTTYSGTNYPLFLKNLLTGIDSGISSYLYLSVVCCACWITGPADPQPRKMSKTGILARNGKPFRSRQNIKPKPKRLINKLLTQQTREP